MNDKPPVPYRRMPMGYLLVWILMGGIVAAFNHINSYGWPPARPMEFISAVGGEAIAGGALWGWIAWRLYFYKKFPPSE